MGIKKDVTGEKYNLLEVIALAQSKREPSGSLVKQVVVRCDCGTEKVVGYKQVKKGKIKSCGCLSKINAEKSKIAVNIGDVFNYWTLLEEVGRIHDKRSFKVRCICGKEGIRSLYSLRKGKTKSCGCKTEYKHNKNLEIKPLKLDVLNLNSKTNWTIIEEISATRNEKGDIIRTVKAQCKCGYIKETKYSKVNDSKQCKTCASKEYKENHISKKDIVRERLRSVYTGIKSRCYDTRCKSYKSYGAKGIIIEESFNTFEKFYNWAINNGYEINKGLEIDRINNKDNYSTFNCRFVSKEENILNQSNINLTLEDLRWIRSDNFNMGEALNKFTCSQKTIENIRDYITFKTLN